MRTDGDPYVVTVTVLGVAASALGVYEDGRWRQHAAEDTRAYWRRRPEKWLATIRAEGSGERKS